MPVTGLTPEVRRRAGPVGVGGVGGVGGAPDGQVGVEDVAPMVARTLPSSARAQTAPNSPVEAPATATGLARSESAGKGVMPCRGRP